MASSLGLCRLQIAESMRSNGDDLNAHDSKQCQRQQPVSRLQAGGAILTCAIDSDRNLRDGLALTGPTCSTEATKVASFRRAPDADGIDRDTSAITSWLPSPLSLHLPALPSAVLPFLLASAFPPEALAAIGGGGIGGNGGNGGGGGGNGGGGGSGVLDTKGGANPKAQLKQASVTLASFAVTKKAFEKITKAFSAEWLQRTGQKLRFRLSFAASGTQARAIISGLPADIVSLSLPLDMQKIEQDGQINPGWEKRAPHGSIASESVVAFVTRAGNPKNIRTWEDLVRHDVTVVTANPKTAGVARWTFLGLWGSQIRKGKTEAQALDFVRRVFDRIAVQPRDAREATDAFYNQEVGDVLLTYENEVILTNMMYSKEGGDATKMALPYVIPTPNVRIEMPITLVDKNVDRHGVRKVCEDFLAFVFTPAAQRAFGEFGIRPVVPSSKFFDDRGILDQIQADIVKRAQEIRNARGML
eukprot:jgi/Mesvir1/21843/Mv04225-RA.2